MPSSVKTTHCELFGRTVHFETGRIARQSTAAVWLSDGGTRILVTVVAQSTQDLTRDFLPLTVNYQEKFSAAGKVLGGFNKRESRPTERETLLSRVIDRAIRPLFPKSFCDDMQIIATVHSYDPDALAPEVLSILGASCALRLSGLPFESTVSAARVGCINGELTLVNQKQLDEGSSTLDMVVAFTSDAVMMVESSADVLPESTMLEAIRFGQDAMSPVFSVIESFCQEVGVTPWTWRSCASLPSPLQTQIHEHAKADIAAAYQHSDKTTRKQALSEVYHRVKAEFVTDHHVTDELTHDVLEAGVHAAIASCEKQWVRNNVIEGNPRIDGRDTRTVRPLSMSVSELPFGHGSGLFTRGETQVLMSLTLSGEEGAQLVDNILKTEKESFMLHYNFPPFSVGEVRFMSGPKRREIGHGNLAKRALQAVLPSQDDFGYTIRLLAETTESNGSSSMATVCSGTLALMDGGVPIKAPVAGIAMGLIKEQDKSVVLTDILGDEDHLGDMDFKVAGTTEGITALQMDIKIQGITPALMDQALAQAREARLHILEEMSSVMSTPRARLSDHAPKMLVFSIHPDKIREVIGRGGATIRGIIDQYGVTIDISDAGLVKVQGMDHDDVESAKTHIEQLVADVEVGKIYTGKVVKIMDFGAFVSLLPGKDGFLHISQIANERVEDINQYLKEGQEVTVKAVEIDKQDRVRLSMKVLQTSSAESDT